jgi:hypothetical protein
MIFSENRCTLFGIMLQLVVRRPGSFRLVSLRTTAPARAASMR